MIRWTGLAPLSHTLTDPLSLCPAARRGAVGQPQWRGRIHFIIVMIRWTGLAPWEFDFPFAQLGMERSASPNGEAKHDFTFEDGTNNGYAMAKSVSPPSY